MLQPADAALWDGQCDKGSSRGGRPPSEEATFCVATLHFTCTQKLAACVCGPYRQYRNLTSTSFLHVWKFVSWFPTAVICPTATLGHACCATGS